MQTSFVPVDRVCSHCVAETLHTFLLENHVEIMLSSFRFSTNILEVSKLMFSQIKPPKQNKDL